MSSPNKKNVSFSAVDKVLLFNKKDKAAEMLKNSVTDNIHLSKAGQGVTLPSISNHQPQTSNTTIDAQEFKQFKESVELQMIQLKQLIVIA